MARISVHETKVCIWFLFLTAVHAGQDEFEGQNEKFRLKGYFTIEGAFNSYKSTPTDQEGCPFHPQPVPLPSPLPDVVTEAISSIDKTLENSYLNATSAPGLVAAISYNGKTLFSKGYGVKTKKIPNVPPDMDTIFRIGSLSKIFVVLTLFQLLDKGKVKSLDDPITDYCPSFSVHNPYDQDNIITLRQMASQLSGLPSFPPCSPDFLTANVCPQTTAEILRHVKDMYLVQPTWKRPSYSNLAYALLAHCLTEKLEPLTSYEEYVDRHFLQPLNMTNTGFRLTDHVKSRMAIGYNTDGSEAALLNLGWAAPTGQMYSSVGDLMKLANFFISDGAYEDILKPNLVKEMGLPVFLDFDGIIAFGTPYEMVILDSYLIRSKGGRINGYTAFMTYIPELNLSFSVAVSGDINPFGLVSTTYGFLLKPLVSVLSDIQPKVSQPPKPQVYIGNYSNFYIGTISVFQHDNSLAVQFPDSTDKFSLAYHSDLLLQVKLLINYKPYPCFYHEVYPEENDWMYFDKIDNSGTSPGLHMPGTFGLLHFTRS